AGASVLLDELVGGRAIGQRAALRQRVGDVLEEPVAAGVVDVDLEVVARGAVAAPAAYRQLQLLGQRLVREIHAVDVFADGVLVGRRVDGDGGTGGGEGSGQGEGSAQRRRDQSRR